MTWESWSCNMLLVPEGSTDMHATQPLYSVHAVASVGAKHDLHKIPFVHKEVRRKFIRSSLSDAEMEEKPIWSRAFSVSQVSGGGRTMVM